MHVMCHNCERIHEYDRNQSLTCECGSICFTSPFIKEELGYRHNQDKPKLFWSIPLGGLKYIADVAAFGASKYKILNWRKGQSASTILDAMFRHLIQITNDGIWAKDEESNCLHIAHLAWNVLCLLHFMALGKYDDVTSYYKETD